MLTSEQKKMLGDMLVKRLATGEDLETATTFLVNYFRKRAHEKRAKLMPKRGTKPARQPTKRATKRAAPKRTTRRDVERCSMCRPTTKRDSERDGRDAEQLAATPATKPTATVATGMSRDAVPTAPAVKNDRDATRTPKRDAERGFRSERARHHRRG